MTQPARSTIISASGAGGRLDMRATVPQASGILGRPIAR